MMRRIEFFLLFSMVCVSYVALGQQKELRLWYNVPAPNKGINYCAHTKGFPYDEDWERWSLPIGNGYMGANIFGRTDTERIQLTEKTLGNKSLWGLGGIENFAEIFLDIRHDSLMNYRRELCLNDAICRVNYDYEGVNYSREYFANYPSNVIAVKLKANKPGKMTFTVRSVLPYLRDFSTDRNGRTGKIVSENNLITMTGVEQYYDQVYESQVKVIPSGGSLEAKNDVYGNGIICVQKADSVVLLITAKTSYQLKSSVFTALPEDKFKENEHPHNLVCRLIADATEKGYEALRKEHIADYQSLFNRVDLSLCEEISTMPTDDLLYEYKRGNRSLYLEELFFQYGRYLLIASSRKGTLPSNLQGVWSQFQVAPWTGGYWHNINVQMNYWPAFNTNLAETFSSYVEYNEAFREAANKEAIHYIKKNNPSVLSDIPLENGWTIGTGASAFAIVGPGGHSGPGTGGFTTKMFWDYYDFTRDNEILKKHTYPAILGMAKFLSKTLKFSNDGFLLADPSSSPEQFHQGKTYQTKGCTFDQGMIWENYHDLLVAAKILKIDDPFIRTIKRQIKKLDVIHIGESGQIKEYREERKYSDIGEPNHRHISHLCTLYPGTLINSQTVDWMKAAVVTLEKRGDKSTGWALAHRLNLWARTKNGDKAYKLYQRLLETRVAENLWNLHPPFQIDGNFGATAGVAEMLLQSHAGYIEPLAALPKQWSEGHFKGLVARGNFVIDADWKGGRATRFNVLSRKGGVCIVQYKGIAKAEVVTKEGKKVKFTVLSDDRISFKTKTDERFSIKFK